MVRKAVGIRIVSRQSYEALQNYELRVYVTITIEGMIGTDIS